MEENGPLTVAVSLTAGMLAHAVARHLNLPSILLLLVAGVALGPDGVGVVQPQSLGTSLFELVGAATAIILFEGGLRLELRRLRHESRTIRRLVTWGGVISAVGCALATRSILGWDLQTASLFGALMMVTGPTVVTPLLHRMRAQRGVATVLEAEGVLIDAVGAITAAVTLEVALHYSNAKLLLAAPQILFRLGVGSVIGFASGAALAYALRSRTTIPRELKNTVPLAVVMLIFELSNALEPESGLAAATVAGMTIGNLPGRGARELAEFKQQLTHLLIGMLFLLLVADVRIADVLALGAPGALAVAVVMFVVRPVGAFACTQGSSLSWRERVLIAWISPRGVVAAAIASLFAFHLRETGAESGERLRALVFATIAATVVWCSLTGPLVAKLLGLRRPTGDGWIVLGGSTLALKLAQLLDREDARSIVVEINPHGVKAAEKLGLRALQGNGLDPNLLARAGIDARIGVIGATSNPEANLLFVQRADSVVSGVRGVAAVRDRLDGVTIDHVHELGARVLFGGFANVDTWSKRLDHREASVEWWGREHKPAIQLPVREEAAAWLPLVIDGRRGRAPAVLGARIRRGERVAVLIEDKNREAAGAELEALGLTAGIREPSAPARGTSTPVEHVKPTSG